MQSLNLPQDLMKLHTTYRSINYRQIIAGQLQELELNSHLKEKRDKQVDTPFALSPHRL